MTNRDGSPDFDPKHRIIGAIVVVALAVIFVPMILGEREAPLPEAVSVPPEASQAAGEANKVAVTRVPPPAPARAAEPATSQAAAGTPATAAPEAATAERKATATAKASSSTESKASAAASSGWVVQVGTFSNATNASRLEQKLRAEGQPVRAERVSLQSGKAVRLRVGPFRDRAAALKAQERIQKDVGVKGVVLAYP